MEPGTCVFISESKGEWICGRVSDQNNVTSTYTENRDITREKDRFHAQNE